MFPRLPLRLSHGGEKFELEVVRVSEDQHRGVRLVSDRRLGEWLVGCIGAYHAIGLEMILSKFQIAPRRNREAGMVEPDRGFAEEATAVGVMPVQGKHQLPVASSEDSPDAAGVRYVEDGVDIEDRFVPSDAGLEIGDRDLY